ncbi:stage II sporulation protein D [Cytobacillus oceanisediminis]|uniref:Stage II sporulation protein D n=1 Tax=Cytobacillus oceanisediminis 2691 TaxID=1196031 RepID=A0A160MFP2_9BACI|nr:stage II sporulation protein D [Cytobacillus oceanisediminis]AND41418.1 stage II sporulation protein D [Cytobacillus oceanisediminis 2691]
MKSIPVIIITFLILVLCVPSLIVIAFGTDETYPQNKTSELPKSTSPTILSQNNTGENPINDTKSNTENITVSVFRMNNKEIENVNLDEYLIGVLASEMPANYELDALKAQAISARTYIMKFLMNENKSDMPQGADITDSTLQQVYKNQDELKEMWKNDNYEKNIKKITQAVKETQGLVMTYNDKLIDASFFAISNGYTENSEDYWTASLPYLRSVPSPWDTAAPDFIKTKTFSFNEVESSLGVKMSNEINVERTSSDRVSTINISGKKLTGAEFRNALGLRSTDFSLKIKGNEIQVTTKGYGHGVGMSQYGANSMATEGKNFKEILGYYFKGIKVEDIKSNQDYNKLVVRNGD